MGDKKLSKKMEQIVFKVEWPCTWDQQKFSFALFLTTKQKK